MPDSVKISELTPRQAVATDILPAIDSTFSQTVRVTAAQIAAIGGGPPGDTTVTTAKLVGGAVTYPKIQDVTANRLLGRTSTAGTVEEIPCTPFMRAVLAAADSASACTAMGTLQSTADATFTGAVKFPDGTSSLPSITNAGDTDTGMYFPAANTIGFSADGYERFRIGSDGALYSNFAGTAISTQLRSAFLCRAWINFDGTGAGSTTISNQHTICIRYVGVWGSLLDDASTRSRIAALETGNTISSYSNVGTEGRTNYTTPGDNTHFRWNGSAWVSVPATTGPWIGSITLASTSPITIRGSGNVSSVVRNSAGNYTINFSAAMPDTNYCIVGNSTVMSGTGPGIVRLLTLSEGSVNISTQASNAVGTVFDPSTVAIAIFR